MTTDSENGYDEDDFRGRSPFDDWLTPVDIFGTEQWEENQLVVDRSHDGCGEINRDFRRISFYIPSGFHFMLAYIEYKFGRIKKRHWEEYKKRFPKSFQGARAVDRAVKMTIARAINDENHYYLHMLALGHHPCLAPVQRELDSEVDSAKSVIEEVRRPADVVLLLKKLLHKSVGWRSELPDYQSFMGSFRSDDFTKEEKSMLMDLIKELTEKWQQPGPIASSLDDEIPF